MGAFEDLAAKLDRDPLDLLLQNVALTGVRAEIYKEELQVAADLIGWKKGWHPRGDKTPGTMKRGLGLSIHTWGGRGHDSNCDVTVQPDGSVEVKLGTQDLGTGTRTCIQIVVAETLGLPLEAINLKIGDTLYPPSGGSGGSTTIGGVSASSRIAATDALEKLFEKVAPSLGVPPAELEAVGGKVQVKGDPAKSLSSAAWRSPRGARRPRASTPSSTAAWAAFRWPTSPWTWRRDGCGSTSWWRCRTAG
jgi:xanthine dehydrogenase YagR molybdenum-binding subunit